MKAVVISGGGAYGAYGAGTLAALNKKYDLISGVSTGALMAPLVALQDWDRLEDAYTTTSQYSIFDGYWGNPFKKNGNVHVGKAILKVITGKKSLGSTLNMRKHIDKYLTEYDFNKIIRNKQEVIVAAQRTDMWPPNVVHFKLSEYLVDDFKDWMWASANVPLLTSIVYKNTGEWSDGGLTEIASVSKALEMGATEVDVIMHKTKPRKIAYEKENVNNLWHYMFRIIKIMRNEIERNDLDYAIKVAELKKAKLTVYWMDKYPNESAMIFNKKSMREYWDNGYKTAFNKSRIEIHDFSQG